MIALILRFYPAQWRARYGDEFEALLKERPLGPFDVADAMLGALDAHLHRRGFRAAAVHQKGIPMSLRIGGWAAIVGGLAWFAGLATTSIAGWDDPTWFVFLLVGTGLLLVALIGLSAFQARNHPRLIWAAFLIPAAGTVVSLLGMVAVGIIGDRPVLAGFAPSAIWMLGLVTLTAGSGLFALASWRASNLPRLAAGILGLASGAVFLIIVMSIANVLPEPFGSVGAPLGLALFGAAWVVVGASAIRLDRPVGATSGLA